MPPFFFYIYIFPEFLKNARNKINLTNYSFPTKYTYPFTIQATSIYISSSLRVTIYKKLKLLETDRWNFLILKFRNVFSGRRC